VLVELEEAKDIGPLRHACNHQSAAEDHADAEEGDLGDERLGHVLDEEEHCHCSCSNEIVERIDLDVFDGGQPEFRNLGDVVSERVGGCGDGSRQEHQHSREGSHGQPRQSAESVAAGAAVGQLGASANQRAGYHQPGGRARQRDLDVVEGHSQDLLVFEERVDERRSEDDAHHHHGLHLRGLPWVDQRILVGNLTMAPAIPLMPRMPPKKR
jgi:hypothetical protein